METLVRTLLVTLFLSLPSPAFALAYETFGNAPMVKQPQWADGIIDVVNLPSRFYAFWVNGNETFYYQGNAQALNDAMRKYASVKADVRELVLLPGQGGVHSFDRRPIIYDWKLHVPSGIYREVARKKHAVMTVHISAVKPNPIDRKIVEKWLADLDSNQFATRDRAVNELRKLGPDAKPFYQAALKERQSLETRRRIEALLDRLAGIDVTDLDVPKALTIVTLDDLMAKDFDALKSDSYTVRGLALGELSQFVDYNDKIIPALIDAVKKEHEWVRRVAAGSLSNLGTKAKTALPALKEGMKDPDMNIRNVFEHAIKQIENAKEGPDRREEIARNQAILRDIRDFVKARS